MSLRHLFFPQTIHLPDSKYNKHVSIIRYFWGNTLYVDGLIESGDIMYHIWQVGLKNLIPSQFSPQKILLLGLAGGSNARLINKNFPKAQITAVEIDPQMVQIGQKYFHLNKINNLKIVVADALDFVSNLKPDDHFDLILVDCFCGQDIPKKLQTLSFIEKLYQHSTYTLINRLWHYQYLIESQQFLHRIKTQFDFVTTFTGTNQVILLL